MDFFLNQKSGTRMKNQNKKKLNFFFFRELCGPLIFKKFLIANAFGSCPTCRRLPRFSTWHACKVCKRKVFGPTGLLVHTYDLFWILDLFCPKYLTPINVYPSLNQYQHDTSFERKVMVVISKTIEEWCMGSWPQDIVSKMVFVFCVRDNTCV